MKKVIIVVILLFFFFSFLFANEIEKENGKITLWGIIGISVAIIFFIIMFFITLAMVNQGSFDSRSMDLYVGERTSLELNPFLLEEEDKITLKFLIKKVSGNKITLQCKICKQGKILLTKVIGIEKGKKVNTQIKKLLNYPINISVCCFKSNNEEQIKIDVERIIPTINPLFDFYSVNN